MILMNFIEKANADDLLDGLQEYLCEKFQKPVTVFYEQFGKTTKLLVEVCEKQFTYKKSKSLALEYLQKCIATLRKDDLVLDFSLDEHYFSSCFNSILITCSSERLKSDYRTFIITDSSRYQTIKPLMLKISPSDLPNFKEYNTDNHYTLTFDDDIMFSEQSPFLIDKPEFDIDMDFAYNEFFNKLYTVAKLTHPENKNILEYILEKLKPYGFTQINTPILNGSFTFAEFHINTNTDEALY
ncbi:MAG: hypothetical protein ACRDAU_13905 [Clostridium sp.]